MAKDNFVADLKGAYNKCADCGYTSTQEKFCPFSGGVMGYVSPELRCLTCTNIVHHSLAKFCAMCGAALPEVAE